MWLALQTDGRIAHRFEDIDDALNYIREWHIKGVILHLGSET